MVIGLAGPGRKEGFLWSCFGIIAIILPGDSYFWWGVGVGFGLIIE